MTKMWTQDEIDAEMIDSDECAHCGGEGFIDGECTCGDDCHRAGEIE